MPLDNKGPGGIKNSYGTRTTTSPAKLTSTSPKDVYNGYDDNAAAIVVNDPLTGEIWFSSGGRGMPGATSVVPSIANFDVFDLFPITARRKLSLPTPYAGVGPEVVHPSVVYVPEGWGGWKYWMAYTPYPVINSDYENPCLAVSNDGENWTTPAGLSNPLAGKPTNGYNADTHLVMAPDYSKLYMIYRERVTGASAGNRVKLMESADGRKWTDPVTILTGTYAAQDYASPSFWFDPTLSKWVMISHNLDGGATYPMQITQSLTADLYGGWAAPQAITIANPTGGRTFWHSAFNRLPDGRVIGLIQDIVNGGAGAAGQLFAAESLDGGLTFAVRRVYADLGFYRPNFNLATLPSGEVVMNVWVGRQDTTSFHIDREDWAQGAVAQQFLENSRTMALYGGLPANYLWWDNFNRADGAIGTPIVGTALTVDTGTFSIANNKLQTGSAGNNRALVSVGQTDYVVEAVFSAAAGTAQWLWFRTVDTNNFYRLGVGAGLGNTLFINKFVGGSQALLSQVTGPIYQSIVNAGDRIRVVCRGRRFRIYVNDVFWQEMADTSFSTTGVRVGVQGTNAGVVFDNVLVTT